MQGSYSRVFNPAWKGHLCHAHHGCDWSHPPPNTFCATSAVSSPLDGHGSTFHVPPPKWAFRQALPSDPEPRCRNRTATSTFFFSCYGTCCQSLQAFLELCLPWQDGAVGTGHFQEDFFAGEVTNGSSAPLGCCDRFLRERLECRAQASVSLPVLTEILI